MLILAVPPIEGNSSGKHTQANQGCTCHSNGGGVSATHNFPTTYMAGMMYTINIGHTGGTQAFTGGFNVMVDKGNLMNAGNGVNIDSTMRSATHTSQGQLGWSFDWMAPVGGSGAATVNVAVLQSDAGPPNDAPVASNVQVAPSPSPLTSEDLTLTYDYTDNDGDPESTQTEIHWYVDGTHNSAYDGQTTIQASSTQAGQKWKVEVAPHDGLDYGSPVMSNEVAIQDIDSDGDGVLDGQDAFPNDGSETTDTDGDGVGDNADAFPNDGSETLDTDGDGVGDNADAFPNDAAKPSTPTVMVWATTPTPSPTTARRHSTPTVMVWATTPTPSPTTLRKRPTRTAITWATTPIFSRLTAPKPLTETVMATATTHPGPTPMPSPTTRPNGSTPTVMV